MSRQHHLAKILVLFFALSLLFGCAGSSQGKQKEIPEFRSGTQGLEMEFLKNSPPKIAFEQNSFPVILRIKNLGASHIPNTGNSYIGSKPAILSLGVEREYTQEVKIETGGRVDGEGNEARFSLEGKSINNLKGDEEIIAYQLTPSKIDLQSEKHPSILFATLCYPYQTELVSEVCIDPDPNGIRPGKKSCTSQDLSFGSGQGAPVTITKIELQTIQIAPGTIRPDFLITIENKGKGDITKIGSYDSVCRGSNQLATLRDLNAIKIDAFLSDNKPLTCTLRNEGINNEGLKDEYVRLHGKQDVVRCTFPSGFSGTSESFTTPLRIVLTYGYTQSISADYLIKKISQI